MTYDPLRLVQYCLEEGIPIQIVDFGKAVQAVRIRKQIAQEAACIHALAVDFLAVPGGSCPECGLLLPFRETASLTVEAPVAVGHDLQRPADERDAYILIHIPRAALDRFESPIVLPGRRPA